MVVVGGGAAAVVVVAGGGAVVVAGGGGGGGVTVTVCVSVAVGISVVGGGAGGGGGGAGLVVVISSCTGGAEDVVSPVASLLVCGRVTSNDTETTSATAAIMAATPTTTASAGSQFVVQVGRLLIVVVVIEPEIGWHIRAAGDVLGFRSRVCPRICVGLARLVTGRFVAAPATGGKWLPEARSSPVSLTGSDSFVRFPSRGFGPLMFAYPVQLPHQHAWLSACILARALGAFFIGATETLPNRAGPRSLGNRATGQLMP